MFIIMINRLSGADELCIFSERVTSIGISVYMREIAAGNGYPYPMPRLENMAGIHQTDSELINFSW